MQTRTYRAIKENTMKDLEKFNNIYIFYKILLISILLVSYKWIISYLFFDEPIDLRIIQVNKELKRAKCHILVSLW